MPYRCLHCDHTCDHPTTTSAACSASGCGFKVGHFRYEQDSAGGGETSHAEMRRGARSALVWCWAPIALGVGLWSWAQQVRAPHGGAELLAIIAVGLVVFGLVAGGRGLTALLAPPKGAEH
jgi:hypothetical protein